MSDVFADAHRRLAADPAGDLPLGTRELVYAALGPRGDAAAHRSRTDLALAGCRRLLPVWEEMRPEDRMPHAALVAAEAVRDGTVDAADARAASARLWAHAENVSQLLAPASRSWVGFACARAVTVAAEDEWFDPADPDPARTELELGLDASGVDCAFFLSGAAAGGPPWAGEGDAGARRAFWSWWLSEAEALAPAR